MRLIPFLLGCFGVFIASKITGFLFFGNPVLFAPPTVWGLLSVGVFAAICGFSVRIRSEYFWFQVLVPAVLIVGGFIGGFDETGAESGNGPPWPVSLLVGAAAFALIAVCSFLRALRHSD